MVKPSLNEIFYQLIDNIYDLRYMYENATLEYVT
jgi:hypothetical protein